MVTENAEPNGLDEVLSLIGDLARKSEGHNYIYRGENRKYPQVSSTLYRRYKDIDAEGFDIEIAQTEILDQARLYARYTGEVDDLELLYQIQHNGGDTNLIDFTTDILIALFFACDGEAEEKGRVILLEEIGEGYHVLDPRNPVHRVIAQKSIFARANQGFVEPDAVISVAPHLKPLVLEYLRAYHGIFTETVYNDLYGFILHQDMHRSAYAEFYGGLTSVQKEKYHQAIDHYTESIRLNSQSPATYNNRGIAYHMIGELELAIEDYQMSLTLDQYNPDIYSNIALVQVDMGNYHEAIQFYGRVIELDPDDAIAYANRGECRLYLSDWQNATDDLATAQDMGCDIVASFRIDYESVADFERRNGIAIPPDIAEMLGG